MVKPRDEPWIGIGIRIGPLAMRAAVTSTLLAGFSGCGMVPKSKLDECRRVSQTLRAENGRLKDVALNLRTQNQDLSERAVDDAHQIAAKDEANEQLIKSVKAYQTERDQLAESYQTLERQVRMAVNPHPVSRPAQLKAFVSAHPGWSLDESAGSMTLSAPSARLFEKGAARLTPEALAALKGLAAELAGAAIEGLELEVVAPAATALPVVAAGFDPGNTSTSASAEVATASARFLAASRAARVRDRLIAGSGLDPALVRISPQSKAKAAENLPDSEERRVKIRLAAKRPETRPE